jgi:hypothetical protein
MEEPEKKISPEGERSIPVKRHRKQSENSSNDNIQLVTNTQASQSETDLISCLLIYLWYTLF